jgi:hypothetical protein
MHRPVLTLVIIIIATITQDIFKYNNTFLPALSNIIQTNYNIEGIPVLHIKENFQIPSSRSVKIQNRELSFRCIAYNVHRITNLVIIVIVSTWPKCD